MAGRSLARLGFMGSGRSVVGAVVADRAMASFHDLDLMVEDEAGMEIPDIFATKGKMAFRSVERRSCLEPWSPGRRSPGVEAPFETCRRRDEQATLRVRGDQTIAEVAEEVWRLWSV